MITARMPKQEYIDLEVGTDYEVEHIGVYIKIKGNPRHYDSKCFQYYKDGKRITKKAASKYLIFKEVGML
jgi:hypothetical protein